MQTLIVNPNWQGPLPGGSPQTQHHLDLAAKWLPRLRATLRNCGSTQTVNAHRLVRHCKKIAGGEA